VYFVCRKELNFFKFVRNLNKGLGIKKYSCQLDLRLIRTYLRLINFVYPEEDFLNRVLFLKILYLKRLFTFSNIPNILQLGVMLKFIYDHFRTTQTAYLIPKVKIQSYPEVVLN
jgi:hypothetical protein